MKKLINWFNKQSTDKKVSFVALAAVGIYLLFLVIFGIWKRYQLQQNGVYYAAMIYDIESGKSGPHFYIEYNYKDKLYTGGFKPDFHFKPFRKGAYIYIKLLPNKPKIHQYLEEGEVSDSLLKVMPKEGWKKLPDVPRQYFHNGEYVQIY